MENTSIEKALNLISVERERDSRELKVLKETQEKQQQDLQESQKQISGMKLDMVTVKTAQQAFMEQSTASIKQMEALSSQLTQYNELLKKPLIQKTINVHHVPKLLYATVALLSICLSLSIGWYETGKNLSKYRNNDTKWRKLLLGAQPILTEIMQDVSTNVEQNPDIVRNSVEKEEVHNAQVWDLQQKMKADSAAMRALKTDKPSGGNSSYIHKR